MSGAAETISGNWLRRAATMRSREVIAYLPTGRALLPSATSLALAWPGAARPCPGAAVPPHLYFTFISQLSCPFQHLFPVRLCSLQSPRPGSKVGNDADYHDDKNDNPQSQYRVEMFLSGGLRCHLFLLGSDSGWVPRARGTQPFCLCFCETLLHLSQKLIKSSPARFS